MKKYNHPSIELCPINVNEDIMTVSVARESVYDNNNTPTNQIDIMDGFFG